MLDAGKAELMKHQSEERLVFANSGGLSILDEIRQMRQKIRDHEQKFRGHDQEFRGHDQKLRKLTESSIGYQNMRSRFLSTYLRDIWDEQPIEQATSNTEKRTAHGGDVLADASLYMHGIRNDIDTFVKLYGLTPARAAKLGEE